MTVEEIEIIVTAKVEEALKEFEKFLPAIREKLKQAEEAFQKIDTKKVKNKLQQAVNFMKKKIQDFKKSSENNEIAIKVNNKDAKKQITQLEKEIDSLQKKITGRQLKLDITNNALDKIRNDTNKSVIKEMPDAGNRQIKEETYKRLDGNANYNSLVKQSDKLNNEIEKYNELLNVAKSKMAELNQETKNTSAPSNKLKNLFGSFKQKIEQVKPSIIGIKNGFKGMPQITQSITNSVKNMGKSVKVGLGHVLRYAGALFSMQGIYSTLSSCASTWLSSQNAGAKQLSANIDYMKYAMGSAFAPVIQYVTGLVYQLLKAIQSVVYALFRVNIFAKASASSYASMAGNAKKAKNETKQLAGIHNEINNVQSNDNSNSGSEGTTAPNIDLSGIDSQMSPFMQKLYDFFKPLVDSWNKYGSGLIAQVQTTAGQIVSLLGAVWGSFEKIITNGTVYKTLELILSIIGNIAEAFANAWKYNGNGDAIIQNLANAFNNLLTAINNVVKSEGFQNWLNNCSDKLRVISKKISEINWQPLIDALFSIGQNIGTIALDILTGLVDIFKWLVENPIVAEILLGIAIAIGVLSTAYTIWSTVTGVLTAMQTALDIALLPLIGIILAIIAVITAIVLVIMNWGDISKWLADTWEWIKQKATEIFTAIGEFFKNIFNSIMDFFVNKWNAIKEFFINLCISIYLKQQEIWNNIKNCISNIINAIKTTISNVLNGIKNIWNNCWNGLKNTATSIFNGIWNTIKKIINSILGGIEGMANGVVNGVNLVIRTLNKLKFTIPDWVPGLGGKTFGFNLSEMNKITLPRLAKGNVVYDKTLAIFGEYAGASNNPEITTPQNIMRDTFEDVLSNYEGNGQPLHVTIQYLGKKIFDDTIDYINSKTRRTGKNTIVTVGD